MTARTLSILATMTLAAAAHADDSIVRHRTVLPIDGRPIDVAMLATPGDEPIRIRLTGTLSSSLDGSEIDAMARRTSDMRWESDGPFVVLPEGARVVSTDRDAHEYTIELPRAPELLVALHALPLAQRHLVTLSEAQGSLSGALFLSVLDPPPGRAAVVVASVTRTADAVPASAVVGAMLGLPLLLGTGLLFHHRRNREERRLERRARAAFRRLTAEAHVAGPAFDGVVTSSARLLDSVVEVRRSVEESDHALKRTAWASSEGATKQRDTLRKKRNDALSHLRYLADRLEETATHLAAHRAGQSSARGVEEVLADLNRDLDTAVKADEEARAI